MKRQKWLHIMTMVVSMAMLIQLLLGTPAFAFRSSLRLSGSSTEVARGQTVTVTASLNPSDAIRGYEAVIRYDADKLTYDGGFSDLTGANEVRVNAGQAGALNIAVYELTEKSFDNIFRVSFTTKANGDANIRVSDVYVDQSGTEYAVPVNNDVTVKIVDPKSSDNALRSLTLSAGNSNVAISPTFAADVTTYSATVGTGTSSIAVVATARHDKATVSNVTGHQNLSYGRNEVKITVTAENGDTRTYTVNVTRTAPTPTPAATSTPTPSPTPEATPTPSPTPTPTPSPTPSPTPVPPVEIELDDGTTYTVSDLPEDVEMPAGFYRTVIQVNGRSVNAFKALQGELTLLYLTGPDGRSAFMVYDELQGAVYPYVQMTVPALSYTFIQPDDDIQIPAGFVETTLLYQGENLKAWRQDPNIYRQASDDVYLVYLMDEMGNKGFYIFNQARGTMTPYPYTDLATTDEEVETTPTETDEPEDEVAPVDTSGIWKILTIAFGLIILILIGMIIWLLVKNRHGGGPPDHDPYDDNYDDYDHPDDHDSYEDDSFDDDTGYTEQSPDDNDSPPPPTSGLPPIPPIKRV